MSRSPLIPNTDLAQRVLTTVGRALVEGEFPRILGPWRDVYDERGDRYWARCDLSGKVAVSAYRDGGDWSWSFDDETDGGDGFRTMGAARRAADESARESGWHLLTRDDAEALARIGRRR